MLMEKCLERVVNSRISDALCEMYKENDDLAKLREECSQLLSQICKKPECSPELYQLIKKYKGLYNQLRDSKFKTLYFQGYKDCVCFLKKMGVLKNN